MKYDLAWDDQLGSIEIVCAYDMVEHLPKLTNNSPIVQDLRTELNINTNFDGEYGHSFGFDVGIYQEIQHGTLTYKARLPRYTMGTCDLCNGKGKRDPTFGDEDCFVCEGSGEAAKTQWKKILVLRANLKLLLDVFAFNEYAPGHGYEKPDMRIKLCVNKPAMDSSSIMIPFGGPLLLWLQSISVNKRIGLDEVVEVMTKAWDIMSKIREYDKYSIEAYCENGRLIMNIPGNAAGIYLGTGSFGAEDGTMFDHNMDTGVQQLTILAGLAQLHSMYREATTKEAGNDT